MKTKSKRVRKAVEYFNNGYNCSQSVVCAYCEDFGIPHEEGRKISAGFGGGIGGLRRTCGALTGAVMLLGLLNEAYDIDDNSSKTEFYQLVKTFEADFSRKFQTSNCKELLTNAKVHFADSPLVRDKEYYSSRPCSTFVAYVCELLEAIQTKSSSNPFSIG